MIAISPAGDNEELVKVMRSLALDLLLDPETKEDYLDAMERARNLGISVD